MATTPKLVLKKEIEKTLQGDANLVRSAKTAYGSLLDSTMCSTYSEVVNTTSGSGNVDIVFTQPANTVLEDVVVICTSQATRERAAVTFVCGNAAFGGEQIVAHTSKSVANTGTSVAAGQGTSIHSKIQTSLQGGAQITIEPGAGYTSTERKLFGRVSMSASPAGFQTNTGAFRIIAKYYNL